jgi:vacuolar-type H+-ATPase subunit F/Vma7
MSTTARMVYIGDAVTAAGLALAGVRTHVTPPRAEAVMQALDALHGEADLVILDQDCASAIEPGLQEMVRDRPQPPIVVIPSMDGDESGHSLSTESARRLLGLTESQA